MLLSAFFSLQSIVFLNLMLACYIASKLTFCHVTSSILLTQFWTSLLEYRIFLVVAAKTIRNQCVTFPAIYTNNPYNFFFGTKKVESGKLHAKSTQQSLLEKVNTLKEQLFKEINNVLLFHMQCRITFSAIVWLVFRKHDTGIRVFVLFIWWSLVPSFSI